jgi:uncharacterized protein (TIGR02679 family)
VLEAGYALDTAARNVTETHAAAGRAEQAAIAPRAAHKEAETNLATAAGDIRLPGCTTRERIDAIVTATQTYKETLAALWPTIRHGESILAQLASQREQTAAAGQHHAGPAALRDHPALAPLLAQLQTTGLLKRLSRSSPVTARALLGQLARVTTALPAGGHPLPALAAAHLGNAHALDPGEPLASLALRAAAGIAGIPFPETQDAETRRDLWASVGVLCDELSTPVCVLNLPVSGNRLQTTTPLLRLLAQARDDAEPLPITLRLLLRHPLSQHAPLVNRDIYVCENPTIMALAADRLGPRCAPLACVNGQYATPAKILLRQLDAAGARLHYHGDFDAGGLAITRRIFASHAATRPWRMTAADYLAAPKGKRLAGAAALSSPWDPALTAAMRQHKRTIHEEAVALKKIRNSDRFKIKFDACLFFDDFFPHESRTDKDSWRGCRLPLHLPHR